jgi:hypothetical protein
VGKRKTVTHPPSKGGYFHRGQIKKKKASGECVFWKKIEKEFRRFSLVIEGPPGDDKFFKNNLFELSTIASLLDLESFIYNICT